MVCPRLVDDTPTAVQFGNPRLRSVNLDAFACAPDRKAEPPAGAAGAGVQLSTSLADL
jgi:hypothetical protein